MSSPAPACTAALTEMTRLHPGRNRAYDGIMGDLAHQARVSDHNLGNAVDITHDPAHGVDSYELADWLRKRCKAGIEHRVSYIISNHRIASSREDWRWRPYDGANPHDHHLHISIHTTARDDTRPWWTTPVTDHGGSRGASAPLTPTQEDNDMTPEQARQLAEVHKMLTALVAPRRPDHKDRDPNAVDLGDILTAEEKS